MLGEQRPLVGVLAEEGDRAGQLVAGGVGAGHEDGLGQHRHLLGGEPVAFLLDGDHVAEQVFTGIGAAFLDHVVDVGLELRTGPFDQGQVLDEVGVEDAEDVGGPGGEELPVLGRGAEELADDRDGVGLADVGDQLALALGGDLVDQTVDDAAHGGSEAVGGRRGEGGGDEAAQAGVFGALHGEDGLPPTLGEVGIVDAFDLGDHREGGVEALVTQDGRDVAEAGDRVAHVAAGQPVLLARLLDGGHGVGPLEAGRVEVGEGEFGDELRHGGFRSFLSC